MYDLGILGGMGPEATSEFFRRLVEYTNADFDQEHINVCILNNCSIPDRTNFIVEKGESPVEHLNKSIKDLVRLETRSFVVPCNTSHYFLPFLNIPSQINFINMVSETILYIENYFTNQKVCILGTIGTIKGKVYEQYNTINKVIYPEKNEQLILMNIIRKIKSNNPKEMITAKLNNVLNNITNRLGEVIFVLACTELSLYTTQLSKKFLVIDAMEVLVVRSIESCGYNVREEKVKLIM